MIGFIPKDSIQYYISDYQKLTEEEFNRNKDNEALIQSSFYNYDIHDRDRAKAEFEKSKLKNILYGVILAIALLLFIIYYQKNRNKKNLLKLYEALDNVNKLKESLGRDEYTLNHNITNTEYAINIAHYTIKETDLKADSPDSFELQRRLRDELIELQKNRQIPPVCQTIITSNAYEDVKSYLKSNKPIPEDNQIWQELEDVVTHAHAKFKSRLLLLTGGKLKASDLHLALLIKCGFTPKELAILMSKSKQDVTYLRKSLSLKAFEQYLGTTTIDNIILLL